MDTEEISQMIPVVKAPRNLLQLVLDLEGVFSSSDKVFILLKRGKVILLVEDKEVLTVKYDGQNVLLVNPELFEDLRTLQRLIPEEVDINKGDFLVLGVQAPMKME